MGGGDGDEDGDEVVTMVVTVVTVPPPLLQLSGELFNRIVEDGPFQEKDAAYLFAQILLSMEYLHSRNIVHRDVKPENILYKASGGRDIKLIDFGYAGVWDPEKELTGLCGTPDYVAPEVLTWYDDDASGTPYGKGSDVWSLGVLLYVILSGCSPFSADEEEAILQLVAEAKYEFHDAEWSTVSSDAKDLITRILVVDSAKRLTMAEMLAHPWLKTAVAEARAAAAKAPPAAPLAKTAAGGGKGSGSAPMQPTIEPTIESVGGKKGARRPHPPHARRPSEARRAPITSLHGIRLEASLLPHPSLRRYPWASPPLLAPPRQHPCTHHPQPSHTHLPS